MSSTETDKFKPMLTEWLNRVMINQKGHHMAAAKNTKLHYWLGVPSIILSAIVATSIFATLDKQPETVIKIVLGITSVLAAGLAALQTFLRPSEKAAKHNEIYARLGDVGREVEQLLVDPPEKINEYRKRVSEINFKIKSISSEAPVITLTEESSRGYGSGGGSSHSMIRGV